jgi:hypothetical protein
MLPPSSSRNRRHYESGIFIYRLVARRWGKPLNYRIRTTDYEKDHVNTFHLI